MAHFGLGTFEKFFLGYAAARVGIGIAREIRRPGLDVSPYTLSQAREVMRVASTSPNFVEAMDLLCVHRGLTMNQAIEFVVGMPASDFLDVFELGKPV
jgi:hypothetical protein